MLSFIQSRNCAIPWGIVMKIRESLDLHSFPPELIHISRNGLFPYSLCSVIEFLTWYDQTYFFQISSFTSVTTLAGTFPRREERERVVFIPHLWILCSKMKLNHPCILNAGQRLNAQSGAVWASFHKSHGTCCAIRELLSTETFQKFQPASEQAECLRDDVLFVQNLQTVVSFPSADIGAARRPEVGALKPSLWEENQ